MDADLNLEGNGDIQISMELQLRTSGHTHFLRYVPLMVCSPVPVGRNVHS